MFGNQIIFKHLSQLRVTWVKINVDIPFNLDQIVHFDIHLIFDMGATAKNWFFFVVACKDNFYMGNFEIFQNILLHGLELFLCWSSLDLLFIFVYEDFGRDFRLWDFDFGRRIGLIGRIELIDDVRSFNSPLVNSLARDVEGVGEPILPLTKTNKY